MKIKRLVIPVYKNVTVNLKLNADQITLLVGQNGMGKSNLLEALLLIFDELYQLKTKGKRAETQSIHYEMEYECKGRNFAITKMTEQHNISEYTIRADNPEDIHLIDIKDLELPNQIIGYYSGENKRIRQLVHKHIQSEERSKRIQYARGNEEGNRPRKLFFAENRHSMLVLTTLFLYKDHRRYGENIKKVLQDIVHLENWDRIHLKFRSPQIAITTNLRKEGLTLEYYRDMLLQGYNLEETPIFWGVRGVVDKLLRFLLYYFIDNSRNYGIMPAKQGVREYFEIEGIPTDDNFKELLYDRFPTPMEFLNALEECFVLKMVEDFDIFLHKEGERERYPYLQLSEGEQQYLTVMGLIALAHSSQDETLFLLDEPDTHINPLWQRNYIKNILVLSNTEEDKKSKAFFISTHSPLLVQANTRGNKDVDLLLFKRDEDGNIQIDTDEEEVLNNWRIDQVLMSKYFDLPSSRPASLDEFMKRRKAFVSGEKKNVDSNSLRTEADEFGYLPTGETMADVEAMVYIHQMAEKLRKEGHL
ncbi:MAG: AAA family ATPase [Prevotella sp.]|nr:AAA family ATPase [Prevotella sp.]